MARLKRSAPTLEKALRRIAGIRAINNITLAIAQALLIQGDRICQSVKKRSPFLFAIFYP